MSAPAQTVTIDGIRVEVPADVPVSTHLPSGIGHDIGALPHARLLDGYSVWLAVWPEETGHRAGWGVRHGREVLYGPPSLRRGERWAVRGTWTVPTTPPLEAMLVAWAAEVHRQRRLRAKSHEQAKADREAADLASYGWGWERHLDGFQEAPPPWPERWSGCTQAERQRLLDRLHCLGFVRAARVARVTS